MKVNRHAIDIELTNRCNALCLFCPRAKTPEQGFMTADDFRQSVLRAREAKLMVMLTGQGESLIHPDFREFTRYLHSLGERWGMTTNASLLEHDLAAHILDSGLTRMTFSVSDLGADYEEVYNLNFDTTRKHIIFFMELNDQRGHPCEVWISVVEHDININKRGEIKKFWTQAGVDGVYTYRQITRGGACNHGHYFIGNAKYQAEAEALMASENISTLCDIAFTMPFVGWNGNYYICCSDYEKVAPLGTVHELSVDTLDNVKMHSIAEGNTACLNCNYDPVNMIRETMFEIEKGESKPHVLKNRIGVLRKAQAQFPELYEHIDWKADVLKQEIAP